MAPVTDSSSLFTRQTRIVVNTLQEQHRKESNDKALQVPGKKTMYVLL